MNNLTKIAALPTGGGCQSALRPEERGAERKPLSYQEWSKLAWDAFYRNAPIIDLGVESERCFSLDELVETGPTIEPVIVYGTSKITGSYGRTYEVTTRDLEPGVVGVRKVWQDERLVWPELCRADLKVECKGSTDQTAAQIANDARRATLKGGGA